jgi:hypothetical protein
MAATAVPQGNWYEALGYVGDALLEVEKPLLAAERALTKADAYIGDGSTGGWRPGMEARPDRHGPQPNEKLSKQAGKYAGWAEALAVRLRELEQRMES